MILTLAAGTDIVETQGTGCLRQVQGRAVAHAQAARIQLAAHVHIHLAVFGAVSELLTTEDEPAHTRDLAALIEVIGDGGTHRCINGTQFQVVTMPDDEAAFQKMNFTVGGQVRILEGNETGMIRQVNGVLEVHETLQSDVRSQAELGVSRITVIILCAACVDGGTHLHRASSGGIV